MEKTDPMKSPDAKDGSIILYYMKNGDTASSTVEPWSYNDITKWGTYNDIALAHPTPSKQISTYILFLICFPNLSSSLFSTHVLSLCSQ